MEIASLRRNLEQKFHSVFGSSWSWNVETELKNSSRTAKRTSRRPLLSNSDAQVPPNFLRKDKNIREAIESSDTFLNHEEDRIVDADSEYGKIEKAAVRFPILKCTRSSEAGNRRRQSVKADTGPGELGGIFGSVERDGPGWNGMAIASAVESELKWVLEVRKARKFQIRKWKNMNPPRIWSSQDMLLFRSVNTNCLNALQKRRRMQTRLWKSLERERNDLASELEKLSRQQAKVQPCHILGGFEVNDSTTRWEEKHHEPAVRNAEAVSDVASVAALGADVASCPDRPWWESRVDLLMPGVLTNRCLPRGIHSMPLDLVRGDHIVTIVTTACLPWLTGTSINPLMRAAYLERVFGFRVILLVPWIPVSQQPIVFGENKKHRFRTQEEQSAFVRHWIDQRLNADVAGATTDVAQSVRESRFEIRYYDAWYDGRKGSIFPLDGSDVTECLADEESDVIVLEEPEHLTWYHFLGPRWRMKARHMAIGIIHTNYLEYIRRDKVYGGEIVAKFLFFYNLGVVNANCDRVIRLSNATQYYFDSAVCNLHGVSPQFLSSKRAKPSPSFTPKCYFLGKMLWSKGYRELCDLMLESQKTIKEKVKSLFAGIAAAQTASKTTKECVTVSMASPSGEGSVSDGEREGERSGENGRDGDERNETGKSSNLTACFDELCIHAFGDGPDEGEIRSVVKKNGLAIRFQGRKDHADALFDEFSVFVNPSVSDVLCTSTAEAAAMGKILVLPYHPSNDFFFENFAHSCVGYESADPDSFADAISKAIVRCFSPNFSRSLSSSLSASATEGNNKLVVSWEQATVRFMKCAGLF